MNLCIKCKKKEVGCYSSCDNCYIGLCDICYTSYKELLTKLTDQKIKNCKICKTNFYDFCDFCHDQTLSYMIHNKIIFEMDSHIKKTLVKLVLNREKKWLELDEEIKILI